MSLTSWMPNLRSHSPTVQVAGQLHLLYLSAGEFGGWITAFRFPLGARNSVKRKHRVEAQCHCRFSACTVFSIHRRQEAVYSSAIIVPWYMTIGHWLSRVMSHNACTLHLHQVSYISVSGPAIFPQGFWEWRDRAAPPPNHF